MVKSSDNKIEIYSVADKKRIKQEIILCSILFIMSVCFSIFMFNTVIVVICIVLLVILIFSMSIYRNVSEEPKLEVVLTKEKLEIYQKKDTFQYEINRIISFSYDPINYNSLNEVFVSYYTEENKKVCKIFILKGMKNTEFCNMANEILNEKKNEKTIQTLNEIKTNEENNLNNEKIDTQASKILCYIGMKKLKNSFSISYDLMELGNILYFIDKNGNEFKLYQKSIRCPKNVELNINKFYAVKMDKNKTFYNISYTDFKFDSNIIDEYKNKMDIRNILIFDDKIINKEISLLEKYRKFKQVTRNLIKIFLILVLIIGLIEKALLKSILFVIIPIFIIIISVIFLIIEVIVTHKIKEIENRKQ